jgi:hypothetical protein
VNNDVKCRGTACCALTVSALYQRPQIFSPQRAQRTQRKNIDFKVLALLLPPVFLGVLCVLQRAKRAGGEN